MDKQTKLRMELAAARAYAAVMGFYKGIKLKLLFLRYGGKDNVPHSKLAEWMGPVDELVKMIGITNAIIELSKFFNRDVMSMQFTYTASLYMNGLLDDVEKYEQMQKLKESTTKNKDVLMIMMDIGDIKMHQIKWLRADPVKNREFDFWLTKQNQVKPVR